MLWLGGGGEVASSSGGWPIAKGLVSLVKESIEFIGKGM